MSPVDWLLGAAVVACALLLGRASARRARALEALAPLRDALTFAGADVWEREVAMLPAYLGSVHPQDREMVCEAFAAAAHDGTPFHLTYRLLDAQGGIRWVTDAGAGVREARGPITRLHGTSVDITAAKTSEIELRQREAALEELQELARLGHWEWRPVSNALRWSREMFRIYGLDPDGPAPTFARVEAQVHPDDRPAFATRVAGTLADGAPYIADVRILLPDGQTRYVIVRGGAIRDETGAIVGLGGTAMDMTERREAQDRLRLLSSVTEASLSGILVTDAAGSIVYANAAFERVSGYALAEVRGRQPADVLHGPATMAPARDALREALVRRQPVTLEIVHYHKRGRAYWVELQICPVFDAAGELTHVCWMQSEITERKVAESVLVERTAYLQAVLQGSSCGIIATTSDGVVTMINHAAQELLGRSPSELVGVATPKLWHDAAEVAAETEVLNAEFGLTLAPGFSTFVERTLRTGLPDARNWTFIRRDGARIPCRFSVTAIRADEGTVIGFVGVVDDLRAEQAAAERLRESERRYALAVAATKEGIYEVDLIAEEVYLSPRYRELIGYGAEAPAPTLAQLRAWLHPDEERDILGRIEAHLRHRAPYEVEHRLRHTDGTYRWFRAAGQAVWDADGRPIRMVGSISDITERRLAEERFRVLFEESTVAHMLYDDQGIIDCNQAAVAMFGVCDRARLIGTMPSAFSPDWQPDGQRSADKGRDIDALVAASGHHRLEWLHRRQDGTEFPAEAAFTRVQLNGRPVILGVVHDLTERKQYEARLRASELRWRTLSSQMPVGVWQTDATGQCLFVNARWSEITGCDAAQALGDGWTRVYHPDDRDRVAQEWALASLTGSAFESSYRYLRADGSIVSVEAKAIVLRGDDGTVTGFLGTLNDVTSRVTAEQELHRYYAEVELARATAESQARELAALAEELARARNAALESVRLKGEFLANMSHEIRTPMNAILGFTDLLLEMPIGPTERDFAQTVRSAAQNLLTIINDILDFSKIEAGQLTLDPLPFDLRAALQDVAAMLAPRAQAKDLELALRIAPGTPTLLEGDSGRIRQVMTNLAGNAIKFTDRGHILIDAEGVPAGPGRTRLRLTIADTGIGIAPDKLEHIFHKFTQADGSTSRRYGGTGLGLAICRQLAHLMGGEITVTSAVGEGSRFTFEVELSAVGAPPEIVAPAADAPRVLIVEPSAVVCQVLQEELGQLGIRCVTVARADTALAVMTRARRDGDPFALVLAAWQMEGMDGGALAEQIRRAPAHAATALAALAPLTRRLDAAGFADAGFASLVLKPVDQPALRGLVELAHGAAEAHEATGTVAAVTPRAAITRPASSGYAAHVLLVEDNTDNQRYAQELLRRLGCTVTLARDGLDALRILGGAHFDIVFMDCHMPGLDGYAATAELRRREAGRRRTPVIAMTASAMYGDREKCLAAGMDDYVSKPVVRQDIEGALERWVTVWSA